MVGKQGGRFRMITVSSHLENLEFKLIDLENQLKPLGYVIGDNWDYDHGYFDYKLSGDVGYQFVRIPFTAVDGSVDSDGCRVKLGKPFLLSHKYQRGLDDFAETGTFSGTFNQFSEPQDPDAEFPKELIAEGKQKIKEVEGILLS
jgi:hypothetical protein